MSLEFLRDAFIYRVCSMICHSFYETAVCRSKGIAHSRRDFCQYLNYSVSKFRTFCLLDKCNIIFKQIESNLISLFSVITFNEQRANRPTCFAAKRVQLKHVASASSERGLLQPAERARNETYGVSATISKT